VGWIPDESWVTPSGYPPIGGLSSRCCDPIEKGEFPIAWKRLCVDFEQTDWQPVRFARVIANQDEENGFEDPHSDHLVLGTNLKVENRVRGVKGAARRRTETHPAVVNASSNHGRVRLPKSWDRLLAKSTGLGELVPRLHDDRKLFLAA
jgi:hypothetical protein